jgi:hypothetical protein
VYAVFEVKASMTPHNLRYAAEKAESVRSLYPRRDHKILAGVLATTSNWTVKSFGPKLKETLGQIPLAQRLNLGCALDRGAFEYDPKLRVSQREEALIFFVLRLMDRLNSMGPAAPVDLMRYVTGLKSFRKKK